MVQEMFGEACPASAPFFGYMGAAAALIFASEFFFSFSQCFFCAWPAETIAGSIARAAADTYQVAQCAELQQYGRHVQRSSAAMGHVDCSFARQTAVWERPRVN
jgi:hypothetical protein